MKTALVAFVGVPTDTDPTQEAQTAAEWDSFANAMGQTPSMMLTYLDSSHPISEWISDTQWDVASWQASPWLDGVTPIISMPMTISGDNADADFKAIISGAWDQAISDVIDTWADAGYKTLYLRPGWEMNGNWMPWSITSANAADFVAAFQHIAALAHASTAASVQVVWSPNEGNYSSVPVNDYYPGNSSVDVIALDTYGNPVDSDTTPSAVATSSSDMTLQTALSMAQTDNKPFALGETGGTDAIFPANLASVVAASGVPVAYMAIWDADMNGDNLEWSQNATTSAAWKQAYDTIANASAALSASTGSIGSVTHDTLSLVLSTNDANGGPTFIVTMDGTSVGSPSEVTASSTKGQSQTFTFTGDWGPGPHTLELEFTQVTQAGHTKAEPTIYVESASYDGVSYLGTTESMHVGGSIGLPIGS